MPYKTVTKIETGNSTARGFKIIEYPGIGPTLDRPYQSELASVKQFWSDLRNGDPIAVRDSKDMNNIFDQLQRLYQGGSIDVVTLKQQIHDCAYFKWILLPLLMPHQTNWCPQNFLANRFPNRLKVQGVLRVIIEEIEYQHLFYTESPFTLIALIQFLGPLCQGRQFSLYGLFNRFSSAMHCVNELVKVGFDPNCKDPLFGGQYVDSLLANEHAANALELLRVLDQPTCHYDYANQSRVNARTLLMWAIAIGAHAVVDHLLGLQQRGIDIGINKQDHRGRTAAHLAAALGYGNILRRLRNAGADPILKDHENRSISEYTSLAKPATRKLLEEFGIHPDRSERASHNYLYGLDSAELPVLYWREEQTDADATLVLLAANNIATISAVRDEIIQNTDPLDPRVDIFYRDTRTISSNDNSVIEAVMQRRRVQQNLIAGPQALAKFIAQCSIVEAAQTPGVDNKK